jgi:hypothetical protein
MNHRRRIDPRGRQPSQQANRCRAEITRMWPALVEHDWLIEEQARLG